MNPAGSPEPPDDLELLHAFGLPRLRSTQRRPEPELAPEPRLTVEPADEPLVFATLATENYLALALTAIRSFEQHHPGVHVVLMLVDVDQAPSGLDPRWTVITPADAGVPDFGWLALKYNATDLCCAMKPFLIRAALRRGRKVVYADCDIAFFAPCTALIEQLGAHAFVVTPHTVASLPNPERFWERPTLGDLTFAGQFNAGLFGVRRGEPADRFMEVWAQLVTQPGAFFEDLGPQMEQNSFNWITCFAEDVHVLRDTAYNAAYWNLHDRSLRWDRLDDPASETSWSVDGRPLVCFHYSGYDPAQPERISKHDHRYRLYDLPSLAALLEHVTELLRENGHERWSRIPYRFARLANSVPLDAQIRRILKRYESTLSIPADPWSAEGSDEVVAILMSAHSGPGSLLPLAFTEIYDTRGDLKAVFPGAHLNPRLMVEWIAEYGAREHKLEELFAAGRQVLGSPNLLDILGRSQAIAAEFGDEALGSRRLEFAGALKAAGAVDDASSVRKCAAEVYAPTPLAAALAVHDRRPDLQAAFPDPLGADAQSFADWLLTDGAREYAMPPQAAQALLERAGGAALTRILSYLKRSEELVDLFPFGLIDEDWRKLGRQLLRFSGNDLDYDFDDVVAFAWIARHRPADSLPYLLELPRHRRAQPNVRTFAGVRDLLAEQMDDPAFAEAFERYRARFSLVELAFEEAYEQVLAERVGGGRSDEAPPAASLYAEAERRLDAQGKTGPRPAFGPGVNLFGYFESAIGLGQSSWGLHQALQTVGLPTARHLLTNVNMRRGITLDDLIERYQHAFDTNVFVTYPHAERSLFEQYPRSYMQGRRNIAHLAWEQRDSNPLWRGPFDRFDQIWTISEFAAGPLREVFGERVKVVPNVLDEADLPAPARKADMGLKDGRFTFLYVFDANSSIERKNPEAVIEAFGKAFAGRPEGRDIELVLKVGHGDRREHAPRLRRLMRAARQTGLPVRFHKQMLSRPDLLRLVSAADCYVSLHRAEGFGYTCAEAMIYGRPVIATGYSGNLEFMAPDNCLLVPAREALVTRAEGPFQRGSVWAEPDTARAADMMREVARDSALRDRIGAAGRRAVRELLSPETVGARIAGYLAETAGGPR